MHTIASVKCQDPHLSMNNACTYTAGVPLLTKHFAFTSLILVLVSASLPNNYVFTGDSRSCYFLHSAPSEPHTACLLPVLTFISPTKAVLSNGKTFKACTT